MATRIQLAEDRREFLEGQIEQIIGRELSGYDLYRLKGLFSSLSECEDHIESIEEELKERA